MAFFSANIAAFAISANAQLPDTRARDLHGWVVCTNDGNYTPISDSDASALAIQHGNATEQRSGNATPNPYTGIAPNNYIPSSAELSAFLNNEVDSYGNGPAAQNPYHQYVTGGFSGTTDQIIEWAAEKWGINANWLRAEYVVESDWNQNQWSDLATVANVNAYPPQSRVSATQVNQSTGLSSVKWNHPDVNDSGTGTEPLRWKSTAFNADYQASQVRFYFDNPQGLRSAWGDSTYRPCENWLSIGGWYNPYPWNNAGQKSYIQSVKTVQVNRPWTQPGF